MVKYIKSDLEFILAQIKIAEAHAGGQQLFGSNGLVPAYNLSLGLRTVDGTYNHLLPGQEKWGAADSQFPTLLDPAYRPAAGTLFDPDGPTGIDGSRGRFGLISITNSLLAGWLPFGARLLTATPLSYP